MSAMMKTPVRNNKENASYGNAAHPSTGKTPLSAKQEEVYLQKVELAQQVREEKERLREEKKRRHEEFLRRTAEKREMMEAQQSARRMAARHASNAAIASKEMEIADLKWTLEQERLHRIEMEAEHRRKQREESAKKARERHMQHEAETRRKAREDEERRVFRLQLAEDMEHARLVKEMQRMEQHEEHMMRAQIREEARMREEAQRARAEQRAKESRDLDEAAYHDVQEYLRAERSKRRESVQFRLAEAAEWKKKQEHQQRLDRILERQDREAELAAYDDMVRYLNSEKERRRQSLQEFLQQESDQRRLHALDRDQAGAGTLDEATCEDMQQYGQDLARERRFTLAHRMHTTGKRQGAAQECESKTDDEDDESRDEETRYLQSLADSDVQLYMEHEREQERKLSMRQARRELEAARRLEAQMETHLRSLNALKEEDLEKYRQEISEKYFMAEDTDVSVIVDEMRRASMGSRASLGSLEPLPAPPQLPGGPAESPSSTSSSLLSSREQDQRASAESADAATMMDDESDADEQESVATKPTTLKRSEKVKAMLVKTKRALKAKNRIFQAKRRVFMEKSRVQLEDAKVRTKAAIERQRELWRDRQDRRREEKELRRLAAMV